MDFRFHFTDAVMIRLQSSLPVSSRCVAGGFCCLSLHRSQISQDLRAMQARGEVPAPKRPLEREVP